MTCTSTQHDKEGFPNSLIETTDRGGKGVAVFIQDQATEMLDLPFLQEKVTGLTLGSDTVIDTHTIPLSAGHGLTTGNSKGHIIELAHVVAGHFYQGEILSIAGDVANVAPPMTNIYEVASTVVSTGNPNMVEDTATGVAIDGRVTPVIFAVKPLPSQSGDITRIVISTTSSNPSDLSTFGGAEALPIGITLRVKRSDSTFKNLYTYRSNFDIARHAAGDMEPPFEPKVTGNTLHGLIARVTFNGQDKHGVVVRLDGNVDEELQVIISELMDNTASGNLIVEFLAQGSELQG